jgi:putative glycosyltransferase
MKLSIVTTLYQSAPYIEEFCARAGKAAKDLVGDDYEIVIVNDGSPDNSFEIVMACAEADPHLVIVNLSRNFGHHKAMMTGLEHAQGELIFLIDSDLEESPEWLSDFHAALENGGHDVIYGQQIQRQRGWVDGVFGALYYRLINRLSEIDLPPNLMTVRLMRRDYVQALLQHREREIMIAGLWVITGYDQQPLRVQKLDTSPTTYSIARKISLITTSMTSFSSAPLVMIFNLGAIISIISVFYISYLVFNWAFLQRPLDGWTSLMASIWLLGGLIILFIGTVGIYVAKIFNETKQRPYTIVKNVYRAQSTASDAALHMRD